MLRKERCIVIKDVRNFKELRNVSQKVFVAVFTAVKIDLSATNFLKMVRNGSEFELVHPDWVMLLVKINHLLLTINSAVNIILYSYKVLILEYTRFINGSTKIK